MTTGDRFDGVVWPWLRRQEGEYAGDLGDGRGPTKYGITQATLSAFWKAQPGWMSASRLPQRTVDLTEPQAAEFVRRWFWQESKASQLPPPLDLAFLDWFYHGGPVVHTLQRLVGIKPTGVLGPVTLAHVQRLMDPGLVEAYIDERELYMRSRKNWKSFASNWLKRLSDLREACNVPQRLVATAAGLFDVEYSHAGEYVTINPLVGRPFSKVALWAHPLRHTLSLFERRRYDAATGNPAEPRSRSLVYASPLPMPVYSPCDGVVSLVGMSKGIEGLYVSITQRSPVAAQHRLMHLGALEVGIRPGVAVVRGQRLGETGKTGYELGAQRQQLPLPECRLGWQTSLLVPRGQLGPRFRAIVQMYHESGVLLHNDRVHRVMAYWLVSGDYDGVEAYLKSMRQRGQAEWDWEQGIIAETMRAVDRGLETFLPDLETASGLAWGLGLGSLALLGIGAGVALAARRKRS